MIDDIVELILKEARGRSKEDNVANIYAVWADCEERILTILENLRQEIARGGEDEKEG